MGGLWKLIIIILVLLTAAGLTIIIVEPKPSVQIGITPGNGNIKSKFAIYGAVNNPGIYEYEGFIRVGDAASLAGGLTEEADIVFANVTKWVEDGETIIIPTTGAPEPTLTIPVFDEQKIGLNTAGRNELMSLPGIGEKRAEEIIKLREKKGKITEKEELLEIQGISEKLLESIYDRLIVD